MSPADAFADIHPPLAPLEAAVEAGRCLFCFDAPCTRACPTHIDVPRFIKKIASGNLRGSALAILDANILGLSCSRVCPVEVLCEGACVLHRYNRRPIQIGRLQRHAMDAFYATGARLRPASAAERGGRVACIGAGPASLACAAELRRHGCAVVIIDARELPGGLNTYGVADYKLRPADSLREFELVRGLGVEFRGSTEVGRDITFPALEREFDAIFLGLGLGPTQRLGIPGDDLPGVLDALRFIAEYKLARHRAEGVPSIAGRVAVIGGGNTAIDAAVAARLLGAREVTMVYRRGPLEMPAFEFECERARAAQVHFVWQAQPVAVQADRAGRIQGLECVRTQPGPPDASGRSSPHAVSGSNFLVACDTVIVALGQSRLAGLLRGVAGISFSAGCVEVDPATGQTGNPRYFAGGDCVNGGREVVDAVAEGKRAGAGMATYLEGYRAT